MYMVEDDDHFHRFAIENGEKTNAVKVAAISSYQF